MAFYDLDKGDRANLVVQVTQQINDDLVSGHLAMTLSFFSDEDTYIRKTAYLAAGRLYLKKPELRSKILQLLTLFFKEPDFKVRQTSVNAAGEIGKKDFEVVRHFFDAGLFDPHHSVRNAVIGSMKKTGEVNPEPLLAWAKEYLHHPDKEIRREICHGIELRGRTNPSPGYSALAERAPMG